VSARDHDAGLAALAARLPGGVVMVVGDVMLDEYLWGDARTPPDATTPVVHLSRRHASPGGAANAAAGIVALGGRVYLGGVLGTDANGTRLAETLRARGIATDGLMPVDGRPTTTKHRIIAGGHVAMRLDIEDPTPICANTEATLMAWVEAHLETVAAVVVSDYGKGAVTETVARATIDTARRLGVPVIVDPKASDFARYRGATVVTPTVHELERACGVEIVDDTSLDRAVVSVLSHLDGTDVLLTRGGDGMSLFGAHTEPVHILPEGGLATDATGAGDTVAAVVAMCLGAGSTLVEAARLAALAAGVVIGKLGTAQVTMQELIAAVS
jgi:rfaE bifunctional protein kinase chain/domain